MSNVPHKFGQLCFEVEGDREPIGPVVPPVVPAAVLSDPSAHHAKQVLDTIIGIMQNTPENSSKDQNSENTPNSNALTMMLNNIIKINKSV